MDDATDFKDNMNLVIDVEGKMSEDDESEDEEKDKGTGCPFC